MKENVAVIVVAAGTGSRFGSSALPKQFQFLSGRRVLTRALEAFVEIDSVGPLVGVLPGDGFESFVDLMRKEIDHEVHWAAGGPSRQASVRSGLELLGTLIDLGSEQLVAVHDGARPLVERGTIDRVFAAARESGAAIPVLPMIDTIKSIAADGMVEETVDRRRFARAQTPQCFRADWLTDALSQADGDGFGTDEAAFVERSGVRVATVAGDESNLKITRAGDLELLARIASERIETRGTNS